jgi:chain length determinant protein EpsF
MTFQQILLILQARYRVALLVLLLTVAAATTVSLLLPKQYTASTAVVVDVKSPDPVAGIVLPGLVAPAYMTTQVDIINSDRVAQRVVKLLRLEEKALIRQSWIDATEGKGNFGAWLAELLQKQLDVKPSHESNVINIGFTGNDAAFAAAAANAFAQAYIDVNLELKVEPARQYASWFEEQTKSLRDKLEKAQSQLSAYQQKSGIVATDERLDFEAAKLNDLSAQLTIVQAQTSDSASKRQSAGGSETLVEVMQSPLINGLKADIARLDAKLQEGNVNLGRNHPQTLRNESELASLRSKLASETQQITSALGTSVQVGQQKERELTRAIATQKARVLSLNNQRDEGRVLTRELESAQRSFEAVSLRSTQTRLESQTIQTNILILNAASEPPAPSKPRVLLNILASIVLGSILGVGLAFTLELFDRRVRSQEDLAEATGLPILASVTSAPSRPGLRGVLARRRSLIPLANP